MAEPRANRRVDFYGNPGYRRNPWKEACIDAADFNARFPVGASVYAVDAMGIGHLATVSSPAYVYGSEAFVFLLGWKAHCPVERVGPPTIPVVIVGKT